MDATSLDQAHAEVRRRLENVDTDSWGLTTPCDDWSVVDLVRHMAVGATMASSLLAGEPWNREPVVEEVASAPDLRAEWERRTQEERAGFADPGALDRMVAHPVMGDIPARQFLGMRVGDAVLHAWDLAKATGGDVELPSGLVAEVWDFMSPMSGFIGASGFFGSGPSGDVGPEAPLQTRLLDLSGRRP
ncbi:MAG TPA: TIGR03086 family metal-binding protein [Acidimicrobiales bacterium]|nr:TIGR03086 family metal-binding protein [Acidimicrobiales bacterium]